jgi:inosine-uridine nucleoside N-ribohydrolase
MSDFNRIPLVIDCDPGIDDAFAIVYASLSKAFDIKAIVSVAGNVPIENTTENADFLIGKCTIGCPLIKGAIKPLVGEPIIAKNKHYSNVYTKNVLRKDFYLDGKLICKYKG